MILKKLILRNGEKTMRNINNDISKGLTVVDKLPPWKYPNLYWDSWNLFKVNIRNNINREIEKDSKIKYK